jgi:hypothetical protein
MTGGPSDHPWIKSEGGCAGAGAPARERLPNRRLNITDVAQWRGRTWMLCIGFDRAGRAREVFIDGNKTGSEFEGLLDDACVLLSILLQTGVPTGDVGRHLGGPRVNPDGDPMTEGERNELAPDLIREAASPIGAVAARIAAIEAAGGAGIREAYAAAHARLRREGYGP